MADTQLTFGRTDDYVFISKPKKGIAYVEARFKDGVVVCVTPRCSISRVSSPTCLIPAHPLNSSRRPTRVANRSASSSLLPVSIRQPPNILQLLATLEREWSPPKLNDDTVISLETDLLKEPVCEC